MALHTFVPGAVLTAAQLNRMRPLTAIKTTNEIVANSDTPQDDDELVISPEANSSYLVWLMLVYTSITNGPDFKVGFSFPVGANFTWSPVGVTPNNTHQDPTQQAGYIRVTATTSTATRTLGTMASAEPLTAAPVGLLQMGATAGPFRLQWAQGLAVGENTMLRAGSVLAAMKIA